ncbi:dynactin subunit 4 isoform X2 [Rhipicephalus microplus]|uniref:dynactin subunit 4 isoform X2 n=1 Tax=Rhipicephalus microplus TaxID=6941 RepID=UPI0018882ED4|nr:dynactin subunit 4-like isoform X2 [Rhipicephalus microplus]
MAADIFTNERVFYVCSCGSKRPITRIYFCRHCSKLRCGDCVSHEVDSNYCSNCLEYMPSPEARMKKNKCATCFECPSCGHTLSVRATTIQVQTPEEPGKAVAKKVYYMACGLCRWATKDVGLPDQTMATGGWQEYENPWSKRVGILFEHYRLVAQRDKMERDRKKASQRAGYLQFSDRYGVSAVVAKKFAGLISVGKENEVKKVEEMQPAVATDELEPLPEDYFTEPVSVAQVCSIGQRLSQPDLQAEYVAFLQPKRKPLLIKRSQRCRECEHNLSKPEFSPASIKFKIQMAAFHHVPEIKIKSVTAFNIGEESYVQLSLHNPTPHVTHVTLLPVERPVEGTTAKVLLPNCEFVLPARDDTAEFDDASDSTFSDDPSVVTFRKANRLGFYIRVIPSEVDAVIVAFRLKHDFTNMVVQLHAEPRRPEVVWMTHTLVVNLGTRSYRPPPASAKSPHIQ